MQRFSLAVALGIALLFFAGQCSASADDPLGVSADTSQDDDASALDASEDPSPDFAFRAAADFDEESSTDDEDDDEDDEDALPFPPVPVAALPTSLPTLPPGAIKMPKRVRPKFKVIPFRIPVWLPDPAEMERSLSLDFFLDPLALPPTLQQRPGAPVVKQLKRKRRSTDSRSYGGHSQGGYGGTSLPGGGSYGSGGGGHGGALYHDFQSTSHLPQASNWFYDVGGPDEELYYHSDGYAALNTLRDQFSIYGGPLGYSYPKGSKRINYLQKYYKKGYYPYY